MKWEISKIARGGRVEGLGAGPISAPGDPIWVAFWQERHCVETDYNILQIIGRATARFLYRKKGFL